MDTATVAGKTYIKAAKAAKDLGYTSDYVGQLCRKGSIEAVMLGKTWYVREGSLVSHKESVSRTNSETTRRDFIKQKEAVISKPVQETVMQSPYRAQLLETSIKYISDSDELLPTVDKESVVKDVEESSLSGSDISSSDDIEEDIETTAEVPEEEGNDAIEVSPHIVQIRTIESDVDEEPAPEQYQSVRPVTALSGESGNMRNTLPTSDRGSKPVQIKVEKRQTYPLLTATVLVLGVFTAANIFLHTAWSYSGGEDGGFVATDFGMNSTASIVSAVSTEFLK